MSSDCFVWAPFPFFDIYFSLQLFDSVSDLPFSWFNYHTRLLCYLFSISLLFTYFWALFFSFTAFLPYRVIGKGGVIASGNPGVRSRAFGRSTDFYITSSVTSSVLLLRFSWSFTLDFGVMVWGGEIF